MVPATCGLIMENFLKWQNVENIYEIRKATLSHKFSCILQHPY